MENFLGLWVKLKTNHTVGKFHQLQRELRYNGFMDEKYIVNIFGAMTTGKSTLVESLQKYIDRIYTVDYDVVKKQISGFYSKRDREVAMKVAYDTLDAVAKTGLSILVLLPPPKDEEEYRQIESAAKDNGYRVINIELVAPLNVLVDRYEQRLRSLQEQGGDTSRLRTIEEFKETVQTPYFKPNDTHTFDSSILSPDKILEDTKQLIAG